MKKNSRDAKEIFVDILKDNSTRSQLLFYYCKNKWRKKELWLLGIFDTYKRRETIANRHDVFDFFNFKNSKFRTKIILTDACKGI